MSRRRPDDPSAVLERAYGRHIGELEDIRRAIADVFASEKRLRIECDRLELAHAKARVAGGAAQSERLLADIAELRLQREAMQRTADDIAAHVATMRSQKAALAARIAAARARSRVAHLGIERELAALEASEGECERWVADDPIEPPARER